MDLKTAITIVLRRDDNAFFLSLVPTKGPIKLSKNVSFARSNVQKSDSESPQCYENSNRREKFRKFCSYAAGAYFFFTAFMLLNPRPPVPEVARPTLGVIHFCAFFVLGFAVGLARRRERSLLFWYAALLIWGVGTEFVQPYVGRFFEWIDVAQNAIGVGVGLTAATRVRQVARRRRTANGDGGTDKESPL